ncbi:helix-turn-helix domain-containing protein [Runella slithyformis]|uniref:Transcriptional regulator, AraC family n=1 Tax=Runella slithyformis (strain ATCC 29530 / DSM 19594 / LMG 11500 / NCIMB 11436 / LSU 4) TaxID=761193 RepID=A0A7U3ZLS0_RUNSL|nr:AraC family transcriptional regulator [Runella slithyformis]AEI49546.1 transcriptional regulator, AraC family [Runella slithyformis DSM 19594]
MTTLLPSTDLSIDEKNISTLEIRISKEDAETVFNLLLQKGISFSCFQDKRENEYFHQISPKIPGTFHGKKVSVSIIEQLSVLHNEITNHITSKIPSVDEAAQRLGLSQSKFKSIFKKVYREPYYQYFKTQKLIQAKNLIEKEEYSVKEVSELLGYSEPIKFILVFKKRYQITPGKLKTKYHSDFTAMKKPQL